MRCTHKSFDNGQVLQPRFRTFQFLELPRLDDNNKECQGPLLPSIFNPPTLPVLCEFTS